MVTVEEISLSAEEQRVYEVIEKLVREGGNRKRAALVLGCSERSIKRYIAGFKAKGKAFFAHGNKGKRPVHALDASISEHVAKLYLTKYEDVERTPECGQTKHHIASAMAE